MKLPKVIIFDVGGTLIKGTWGDSILGYKYLYDEILDVKESMDDYLEFVSRILYMYKQYKHRIIVMLVTALMLFAYTRPLLFLGFSLFIFIAWILISKNLIPFWESPKNLAI
jgi:hypothetical protein